MFTLSIVEGLDSSSPRVWLAKGSPRAPRAKGAAPPSRPGPALSTPLLPLPHLSPLLPVVCTLFCTNQNLSPFVFMQFHTLSQKHPGWGALLPTRAPRFAKYPLPFNEEKMKPQTANSVVLSVRCAHRTPGGRQCRLPTSDAVSGLCPQHRAQHQQMEAADHYPHLTRNYHDFQTAQGSNHSLHSLYELLAQNRISPRRAAVLAYTNTFLLPTPPQINPTQSTATKL